MDTATKRASAINISSPWRGILPLPDGSIDAIDRQVVSFMYGGILATVQAVVAGRYQDYGIWPPQSAYERQRRKEEKLEIVAEKAVIARARIPEPDADELEILELQELREIHDIIRISKREDYS